MKPQKVSHTFCNRTVRPAPSAGSEAGHGPAGLVAKQRLREASRPLAAPSFWWGVILTCCPLLSNRGERKESAKLPVAMAIREMIRLALLAIPLAYAQAGKEFRHAVVCRSWLKNFHLLNCVICFLMYLFNLFIYLCICLFVCLVTYLFTYFPLLVFKGTCHCRKYVCTFPGG